MKAPAWTTVAGGAVLLTAGALIASRIDYGLPTQDSHSVASNRHVPGIEIPSPVPPTLDEARRSRADGSDQSASDDLETDDSRLPQQQLAPEIIAASFDAIAESAAAGDVDAATTLYLAMSKCRGVPRTLGELQSQQAMLRTQRHPASETTTRATQLAIDALDRSLVERFDRCRHFAESQINREREFLRLAASLGDNEARRRFFLEPPLLDPASPVHAIEQAKYRAEARRFLEDAIADGDRRSLRVLSDAYRTGALGSQDSARAYEYPFAYAMVADEGSHPAAISESRVDTLERLRASLTPEQASSAESRAEQLVRECCSGP
jgi:hypothetical protein